MNEDLKKRLPGARALPTATDVGGRPQRAWCGAVLAALLLGGVAPSTTGCVFAKSCTDIGCRSGVSVSLKEEPLPNQAKLVRACLNDRCLEVDYVPGSGCAQVYQDGSNLSFCVYPGATAEVFFGHQDVANGDAFALTVEDTAQQPALHEERSLEYEKSTPNGPDCAPTCHGASFEL